MMTYLENLENAETEEERVRWDKAIHYLLIEASGNFCMLANYKALNKIMDEYIPKMRGRIIEGMHSEQFLSRAHRTLAEGFAEGNLEKAREGLYFFRAPFGTVSYTKCYSLLILPRYSSKVGIIYAG